MEMMGLEPTTPCLQSQIERDCHLRRQRMAQVTTGMTLSVVVRWRPVQAVVNGTLVARPARTASAEACEPAVRGPRLGRAVSPPAAFRMAPVPPLLRIWFGRSPIERALGVLLGGSVVVVSSNWDSLSWHARGVILAVYGVLGLAFGLNEVSRTRELFKSRAWSQGTVVDVEEDTGRDDHGARFTNYYPVVRFTTVDGSMVEFTSTALYGSKPEIGTTVDVRYLPEDPEQAEIDRDVSTLMLPAVTVSFVGVALLVAGAVVYFR